MRVRPFQITYPRDISGMVKTENLAYNFGINPQKATEAVIKLRRANEGQDMNTYLSQYPIKKFKTQDDFVWDIEADGDKNIPLAKCSLTPEGSQVSATDQVGKNHTEFYLTFPEDWFFVTNVIVGEELEEYQVRVKEPGVPVAGGATRYKCELVTGDVELFIPTEEVAVGKRFSKDFSLVEGELGVDGGGIHHNFPYTMKGTMSMIRMKSVVPGSMVNGSRPVMFAWKDSRTGKIMKSWLDKLTYDFDNQFLKEQNYLIQYARSNASEKGEYFNRGTSGNIIKQGDGIKAQKRQANYDTYNEFNVSTLADHVLAMSVGKYNEGERKVLMSSGDWGHKQFHTSVENVAGAAFSLSRDNFRIYNKGGNDMGYRGQFTEYYGSNGVMLQSMVDTTKDNNIRNKKLHPSEQGLVDSYNYDIYNTGTTSGEANIQKVQLETNGEIRKFREGLRSPFTRGEGSMQVETDGWEEHRAFIGGAMVLDPEGTGSYDISI